MELVHDDWAIDTLVTVTLVGIFIVALLVTSGVLFAMNGTTKRTGIGTGYSSSYRRETVRPATFILIAALVTAAMLAGITFPWSMPYHAYADVSGTVRQADTRLLPSGGAGAMEEKIVVLYEESPRQFGCEDTRCASARPGDTLTLSCIRVWEFNATDGYDCVFKGLTKAS